MAAKIRFSTILAIARILPKLKPVLAELVVFAESLFPEPGNGRDKLERVKEMLAAIWNTLDVLKVTFDEAWPTIAAAISAIVAAFNRRGWPEPKAEEPAPLTGGVDD